MQTETYTVRKFFLERYNYWAYGVFYGDSKKPHMSFDTREEAKKTAAHLNDKGFIGLR